MEIRRAAVIGAGVMGSGIAAHCANAGIPSLLNWHFTDRYYHTNLDRPEKTSAAEMVNVGVAVATSAWFLASADEPDALATVDLIDPRAALSMAFAPAVSSPSANTPTATASAFTASARVLDMLNSIAVFPLEVSRRQCASSAGEVSRRVASLSNAARREPGSI